MDALKEMGNIGAGNAATALSQMLGSAVSITVPAVRIVPVEKVADLLGGPEAVVAAVYMKVFGDCASKILVLLSEASIYPLLNLLLRQVQAVPEGLAPREQSALKELGNILGGAYLNALSKFLGLQFILSVPALAVDMMSCVTTEMAVEVAEKNRYAIFIETRFSGSGEPITGYFFMIPEPGALDTLLDALMRASGLDPQP